MVRRINEDFMDSDINYLQQFNEFIRDIRSLAVRYGIDVMVPTKDIHPERNIGRAAIYFSLGTGEDLAFIDYYFDYAEDPDYPDRDWFVTFNIRNYVIDKSYRIDFYNNEEALSFLREFLPSIVNKFKVLNGYE